MPRPRRSPLESYEFGIGQRDCDIHAFLLRDGLGAFLRLIDPKDLPLRWTPIAIQKTVGL